MPKVVSRSKSEPEDRDARFREELKQKIRRVRASIPGEPSRADFADKIGADRAQIRRWEEGLERPSNEMMQRLAAAAATREERLWFWHQAIKDNEFAKLVADLRNEISSWKPALPDGIETTIPLFKENQAQAAKEFFPPTLAAGRLKISAERFGASGQPIGLIVQPEIAFGPPRPFAPGDLAIVDRTFTDPALILRSKRLIALWVPHLFGFSETQPRKAKVRRASKSIREMKKEEERERERQRIEDYFLRRDDPAAYQAAKEAQAAFEAKWDRILDGPAILYGSLEEQCSIESAKELYAGPASEAAPEQDLWRLVFKTAQSGASIPLTAWVRGIPSRAREQAFLHGVFIAGAVIGWMSGLSAPVEATAPKEEWVPAIPTPDCECGRKCECVCHGSRKADGSREKGRKRWGELEHTEPCCGPGSKRHEELCSRISRQ